jgi:hypothetical protein
VKAVFDEFMREYVALATSGDPPGVEAIAPVLIAIAHPLRGDINTELVDNYRGDRRREGAIEWRLIEVVEVDLTRVIRGEEAPFVELRYCLDFSNWVTVSKETGERLSGPGSQRAATAEAELFDPLDPNRPGPQWHVYEWGDEEGDEPC